MKSIQQVGRFLKDIVPFTKLDSTIGDIVVTGLAVDSRKIKQGDCFIAYPGCEADGRDYLVSAFNAGAVTALVEANGFCGDVCEMNNATVIPITGLKAKLGDIAQRFFQDPSRYLTLMAVTGTNGKTSVSQMVAGAIEAMGSAVGVMGTLGNGMFRHLEVAQNTTPDVVDANAWLNRFLQQKADFAVMETSSHGLDQGRIDGFSIHTAVVTNITQDHLDYHGSMDAYAEAKALLAKNSTLQHLVLNADDSRVNSMADRVDSNARVWRYSVNASTGVDVYARELQFDQHGLHFNVVFQGYVSEIHSPLIAEFNVSNLLAALTALLAMGFGFSESCQALSNSQPISGRMQIVSRLQNDPMVVVDFAHTPDALEKALSGLRPHCEGKIWCVFGCGGGRDTGKRPIMTKAVSRLADEVIITTDNPRFEKIGDIIADMLKGISIGSSFQVIEDRSLAVSFAITNANQNDIVLLAGKGHEQYQEVEGIQHPYSDIEVAKQALLERRTKAVQDESKV